MNTPNIYCETLSISKSGILDSQTWIVYVDTKTLKEERSCNKVCNEVQQSVCTILKSLTDTSFRKVVNIISELKSELQSKVEWDTKYLKSEQLKHLTKKSRSLHKNI